MLLSRLETYRMRTRVARLEERSPVRAHVRASGCHITCTGVHMAPDSAASIICSIEHSILSLYESYMIQLLGWLGLGWLETPYFGYIQTVQLILTKLKLPCVLLFFRGEIKPQHEESRRSARLAAEGGWRSEVSAART